MKRDQREIKLRDEFQMADLRGEVVDLPLEDLAPNDWNPQKMNKKEFDLLCDSMRDGMIDPIQVVPVKDREDGKQFLILGGQHRFEAAASMCWETIPALVITDTKYQDGDVQRFCTMRMNTIHGHIDPEKFVAMYDQLAQKYEAESLQKLMGFADNAEWTKLVGGVKESLKDSGLPKEMVKEFSEVVSEMQSVDDLSKVLENLFKKHGEDLKWSFMVFTFGNQDHVYVQCEADVFKMVQRLTQVVKEERVNINEVLRKILTDVEIDFDEFKKVETGDTGVE